MKTGKLRKAGGATVVTIPASLLAEMDLHAGQQVAFRRVGDHIVLRNPVPGLEYQLDAQRLLR